MTYSPSSTIQTWERFSEKTNENYKEALVVYYGSRFLTALLLTERVLYLAFVFEISWSHVRLLFSVGPKGFYSGVYF